MLVRGSVLVNTARWSLVDDGAVLDALESGTLSSYAVDTFDTEPPPRDRLLLDQRTITTPHIGGYTDASSRRAVEQAVTNLIDILGTAVSQHDAVDRARL
jgi:D-3-phosphoglycerate dehydrogenase